MDSPQKGLWCGKRVHVKKVLHYVAAVEATIIIFAMETPFGLVRGRTVYPKKWAHGFCFAVLCCGYTLTDFPISIRLTSLALWQTNDCPSASKATLMNMDKCFMWIHYERLHNHNNAKHTKPCAYFLGYTVATVASTGVEILPEMRRYFVKLHETDDVVESAWYLPFIIQYLRTTVIVAVKIIEWQMQRLRRMATATPW